MKRCLLSALAVGLFLSANVMAQVPSYVPSNGLVGWWPFNGNANDESGNGNNGTVNGATLTADRFGNSGKAFSFDGVSNLININATSTIPQSSNYSISLWFNSPVSTYNGAFISMQSWFCKLGHDQSGIFYKDEIGNQANDWYIQSHLLVEPTINSWHQLIIKKVSTDVTLYLDLDSIGSITTYGFSNFNPSSLIQFGYYCCSEYFDGSLDDIGIWNRALTQQEITDLYNGCSVSTITSQPTNQTVNPTTSAQFIINTSSGSSFQWQTDLGFGFQNLSNAGQYNGANNDTLVVSNASTSNNNQQFRCIVNSAGCADTSNIAVLTVSTVGMNELSVQGNVSLYPNPTQSSFEIQTNLVFNKIEIRDMQGRIVKTENTGKIINIASLQKGTYLVKLIDENSKVIAIQRIIKE